MTSDPILPLLLIAQLYTHVEHRHEFLWTAYLKEFNQDLDVDAGDTQREAEHGGQRDEEHNYKHPQLENSHGHGPQVLHC